MIVHTCVFAWARYSDIQYIPEHYCHIAIGHWERPKGLPSFDTPWVSQLPLLPSNARRWVHQGHIHHLRPVVLGCTGHHLVEESYWKGGMKMPGPPKGPQPFCSGKVQESHHSPVPSRSSEKRWKKDEPGMQRKGKRDPLHWSKCQNKNTSIEVKWCRMQDSSSSKQDNCNLIADNDD